MDRHERRMVEVSLLVGLTLVAASCGGDEAPDVGAADRTESAALADYSITLNESSAPEGDVTFEVTNHAEQVHEFVVLKTELAEDALPTDENGDVDEAGDPGIALVDEIEDIEGGATQSLTVTMDAGSYVLICNLPGHYSQGMHAGFTVE